MPTLIVSRLSRTFIASAFAAWLAAPLVMIALGAGSGFANLERRRPAKLPELPAGAILDSRFYAQLGDYFGDRVPLRVQAVAADSWIDLNLFGDSPSSQVVLGADGWLFSRQSLMAACGNPPSPQKVVATIRGIDRILRASGRRFIFLVAPNKEAIYPEYLGPAQSLAGCSRAFRQELRSQLQQAALPDAIDLWQALDSLKQRLDREVYFPHDTHWTADAALEATRRIVERLDPALWDDRRVVTTSGRRHRGDLANLIGRPTWEPTIAHTIARDVQVQLLQRGRFRRLSASGDVFSKRVLVIDDSFGRTYRESLSRFLGDSTWIHWREHISPRQRAQVAAELARAEVVVFEIVERLLADLAGKSWQDLPVRLVAELSGELPATELDLGSVVSMAQPSRVDIDLPPAAPGIVRYLIVDLEVPGRQPSVVVRLTGRRWRHVRVVDLSTEAEGRRLAAEIPPAATTLAIRWADVRGARLIDLPLESGAPAEHRRSRLPQSFHR